jgi:hypothetical protein
VRCVCVLVRGVRVVFLDFSRTQAMQDSVAEILAREPIEAFLTEVKEKRKKRERKKERKSWR